MKTIEMNIAKLLIDHVHLRNNDNELILVYWDAYDDFGKVHAAKQLTPVASIIRARQKLQSQGYFLPTDDKVIERRRLRETEMHEYALSK